MTPLSQWLAGHRHTALVLRAGYLCLVELGKTQAAIPEVTLYASSRGWSGPRP
jgi:hypothetical protein